MNAWDTAGAKALSAFRMSGMGDRWAHVAAVGQGAEAMRRSVPAVPEAVVSAAWLHDLGYVEDISSSGFHPLDGARYLREQGAPDAVIALVAYHSGAEFEAEERGLASDLAVFERPNQDDLDLLTFADMTTGPTGRRVSVDDRLAEILERYEESDPVHRAVTRSSAYLRESAARAAARLGLPNEGAGTPL